MSRGRIFTDAGVEIQCAKCKEFWPEDPEFFFFTPSKGYHSWCKACYREDPKRRATVQRAIAKRAANHPPTRNPSTSTEGITNERNCKHYPSWLLAGCHRQPGAALQDQGH